MSRHSKVLMLSLFFTCAIVAAANTGTLCFHFTWLGPRYDNNSVFMNATCSDATRLYDGVPCMEPLVVSYDGSWPDVEYILRHHKQQATCTLGPSDVCAQYSYYFDGKVENSTYMCTRAVNTNDQAVSSGCYTQTQGSYTTRVCFCRSIEGGVPCNGANVSTKLSIPIIVAIAVLLSTNKVLAYLRY